MAERELVLHRIGRVAVVEELVELVQPVVVELEFQVLSAVLLNVMAAAVLLAAGRQVVVVDKVELKTQEYQEMPVQEVEEEGQLVLVVMAEPAVQAQ